MSVFLIRVSELLKDGRRKGSDYQNISERITPLVPGRSQTREGVEQVGFQGVGGGEGGVEGWLG